MIDVRHVMWRIDSDLRILRVQHNMTTQEREEGIMNDLVAFVYRSYIEQIEFRFVRPASNTAPYRVRYAVTRSWAGEDDDDSGGLRYCDLRGTSFMVVVSYSEAWTTLPPNEKAAFLQGLRLPWGPAADVADGPGYWTSDRTYGSGGLGVVRSVFRPF
jgi:hypothetical protein